jgi:hypothetical protein
MSAFVTSKTTLHSKHVDCLKQALEELFGAGSVEVHNTPQNLVGYQGDTRKQAANVIVRRKFISTASNDIGFLTEADGSMSAVISEWDRDHIPKKFGMGTIEEFTNKVQQNYVVKTVEKVSAKTRMPIVKKQVLGDGTVVLNLVKR